MGAPRARAGPDLVGSRVRAGGHTGSAAAVLDFAVGQILRDDTALGALPTVLERLAEAFGLRAALAFQPSAAQPARVLAAYPPGAVDPGALAKIGALTLPQRDAIAAAEGGPVVVRLGRGSGVTGSGGAGSGAAGSGAADSFVDRNSVV